MRPASPLPSKRENNHGIHAKEKYEEEAESKQEKEPNK